MFISVTNQKGGTGKSTLAIHIAATFASYGQKTLLIDADPQNSAMGWFSLRCQNGHPPLENLSVVSITNGTIHKQINELQQNYAHIVIDGTPRGDELNRDILVSSDISLIPTRAAGFDMWAADSITKIIPSVQSLQEMAGKPPLEWYYVINFMKPRTNINQITLKAVEDSKASLMESYICDRACYMEATSQGLTIFETEPNNSKAVPELTRLIEELNLIMRERVATKKAA